MSKTSDHQAGPHQQDQTQSNLNNYQRIAPESQTAAARRSPAAGSECLVDIRVRRFQDWHQTKQDSGKDGDCQSKNQHAAINADLTDARQLLGGPSPAVEDAEFSEVKDG